jgi:hypothetical protein
MTLYVRPLLLCISILVSVLPAAAQPSLQFSPRALSVRNVTPGGRVAVFGIAYGLTETRPPIPFRSRHAELLNDDDRDGVVTLTFQRDIPTLAVWVTVDVQTGSWTAQGSPGYEPRVLSLQDLVRNDNAGQLRKLTANLPEIEVLLVRPGNGAWVLNAAKQSRVDESGRGEPLRVDVDRATPLGGSTQAAHTFRPGDVVVLIDPLQMAYAVTEVGK